MDKNTLSNYGWIVIAVLVLAVMIALATPFGKYIESGVRSTTAGLFDTSEKAMNVVGMSAGDGNFESGSGADESDANVQGAVVMNAIPTDAGWQWLENGQTQTFSWDEIISIPSKYPETYAQFNASSTSIADEGFSGAGTFISVTIPNSVTSIGKRAFIFCDNLTNVVLPNQLSVIDTQTFVGCASLRTVTIPESVTTIQDGAFSNCQSLTNIIFKGTVAQWNAIEKFEGTNKMGPWNLNSPSFTVTCTDGTITIPACTE